LESRAEAAADTRVEENLWSAIRSLEESASLNDRLVREFTSADEPRPRQSSRRGRTGGGAWPPRSALR
jgi:hypothetical protein